MSLTKFVMQPTLHLSDYIFVIIMYVWWTKKTGTRKISYIYIKLLIVKIKLTFTITVDSYLVSCNAECN
jgi:hypothetical protein